MSKAKFASLLLGAFLVTAPSVVLHAETATPQSVGLSSERLQRVDWRTLVEESELARRA